MRRALLAMVTAFLVARPLVIGEDPGLLSSLTGISGLILSMLWLVTATAWAAWRAWFRQDTRIFGSVEVGLAAVVALVFLSSFAGAHYKHPAVLIACEWLVLFLAFVLVRQLARRPGDLRGLMAVLVASAVSLSAHAIYQAAIDLPRNRAMANDPELLRAELAKINEVMAPDDPRLEYWKQRLEQGNVFATYANPNSFAGYLALIFPIAAGWAWAARRQMMPAWRVIGAGVCAASIAIALWLTHSRGAILGMLLAGGVALAVYWRNVWWPRRAWLLAGLAGLGLVLFAASRTQAGAGALAKATRSFGLRAEYWDATLGIIRDHAWLGVGPGNFGRLYPRYMSPSAYETVGDPHNFVLELAATSGVFAMLALLFTLGVFFLRVSSGWFLASAKQTTTPSPLTTHHAPLTKPRWDLFLGGMAGLLLGFLLRAGELSADELPLEAGLSCMRSVIWFAVFGLLEGIPWAGNACALALATGVAALLLNLGISAGIAWPSVAQPLWVMAALALLGTELARTGEADPERSVPNTRSPLLGHQHSVLRARYSLLSRLLPLPILTALAVVYLLFLFLPVTRSATYMATAASHYGNSLPGWRNAIEPRWRELMDSPAETNNKERATLAATAYLKNNIITPLRAAIREDPGDSMPPLEMSRWLMEQWKLTVPTEQWRLQSDNIAKIALDYAGRVQKLDPDSKAGYQREYEICKQRAERQQERAGEFLGRAVKALTAVVQRDPTEARLRYELAELLFKVGDRVGGRRHAEKALELHELADARAEQDKLATVQVRRLTGAQRAQIQRWLGGVSER